VSRNGSHHPPRPRIELRSGTATPEEAAAIAAAIERFLAENAPAPGPSPEPSRWQRAALSDGVTTRTSLPTRWGAAR
jgi:hypothetical protein